MRRVEPTDAVATLDASAATALTPDQVELLKRTVAAGVSDDELGLFLEVCKGTGLNPFQKQIYAIVRDTWNPVTKRREPKMTIQTGIDGYRLIASRTGRHAGTSDPEFGTLDGEGHPEWARITVRRLIGNGHVAEFTATARWREYVQLDRDGKPQGLWKKMPHTMLGKCVEALALRKAFPAELSGVYTREEMMQAEVAGDVAAPPARRIGYPGESLHAGPTEEELEQARAARAPAAADEAVVIEETGEVLDDDIAAKLRERLERVGEADGDTLNRWYAEANEGGKSGAWPASAALALMNEIKAEAARRKA